MAMALRILLGLILTFTLLTCTRSKKDATLTKPNIVLFLADDWSWPHAGLYGDSVVSTPNFDRLGQEGMTFTNAYCAAPSCTPSRAAILTGMYPHELKQGANLWGFLPVEFPNYASILSNHGYAVGYERKGWAPGNEAAGGYEHNPAGKLFENFKKFYDGVGKDQPFCYWFGSKDPHRPYEHADELSNGRTAKDVVVPPFLPDVDQSRQDLLDYYAEVKRFDTEVGEIISFLDKKDVLDNTIIVITSDNGMPFPRAKGNVYDMGSKMPLVVAWKNMIKKPIVVHSYVNLTDLAPTFLTAARIPIPQGMKGKDLFGLAEEKSLLHERHVFLERERHAYVRTGNVGYPIRAIRNDKFLYIKNLAPDRWPAGDPELVFAVGPYGDVDQSPTKEYILSNQDSPADSLFYHLAFAKRPAKELYDLTLDPHQLNNVAGNTLYQDQLEVLDSLLKVWQKNTHDPRVEGAGNDFESYPYFGGKVKIR